MKLAELLQGKSQQVIKIKAQDCIADAAIALTDRASLAGIVRAHMTAKEAGLKLLVGAEFTPAGRPPLLLWATDRAAYGRLSCLITEGRRRAEKGECRLTFEDLADRAEGRFAAIDHRGGKAAAVTTPYDEELASLSAALNETYVPLGEAGRERAESLATQDRNAAKLSPAAAAARARTKANPRFTSGWDLVSMLESGETTIYEIDEQELPEDLRRMTPEEREVYVEELRARREELRQQIAELSAKRRGSVAEQIEARGLDTSKSFDTAVREAIRSQAADKGFELPEE